MERTHPNPTGTHDCHRCEGKGYGPWQPLNGRCLRCNGTGYIDPAKEATAAEYHAMVNRINEAVRVWAGDDIDRIRTAAHQQGRFLDSDYARLEPSRMERMIAKHSPNLASEARQVIADAAGMAANVADVLKSRRD